MNKVNSIETLSRQIFNTIESGKQGKCKIKFDIRTFIDDDKRILQDVHSNLDDAYANIFRQIMDTKEEKVREALIKLGWKPPEIQEDPCRRK